MTNAAPSAADWLAALRRRGENVPRAVAVAVWAVGAMSVLSALVPAQRARLALVIELVGSTAPTAATATTAAMGVGLMLLAGGLRRRQRAAWGAALFGTVVGTVLHVVKGLDVEEASATAAVAVALVATRRQFSAARGTGTRRLIRVLLSLLVIDVASGLLLLLANADDLVGPAGLLPRLQEVMLGLVGAPGPFSYADDAGAAEIMPPSLPGSGPRPCSRCSSRCWPARHATRPAPRSRTPCCARCCPSGVTLTRSAGSRPATTGT